MKNTKNCKALTFLIAVLTVCFLFSSCRNNGYEVETYEEDKPEGIVLFKNSLGTLSNGNDAAVGAKEYALENGIRFISILPESFEDEELENTITDAIMDGYQTVICTGFEYYYAVSELSESFSDVEFILFDAFVTEDRSNVTSIVFDDFDAGFLAGYISASAGHRNLGFLGAVGIDSTVNCSNGYISGICKAAENNPDDEFEVSVAYANTLVSNDYSLGLAETMYENGCENVLAVGGSTAVDCEAAAEASGALYSCFYEEKESESFEFAVVFDHGKAVKKVLEDSCSRVAEEGILTITAEDGCIGIAYSPDRQTLSLSEEEINGIITSFINSSLSNPNEYMKDGELCVPENVTVQMY